MAQSCQYSASSQGCNEEASSLLDPIQKEMVQLMQGACLRLTCYATYAWLGLQQNSSPLILFYQAL